MHGLALEVGQRRIVEARHERPARRHDDGCSRLERDGVPLVVGVDVAGECHVSAAIPQRRERGILRHRRQVEPTAGPTVHARPAPTFPGSRRARTRRRESPAWGKRSRAGRGAESPAIPRKMTDAPREDRRQQPKPPKEQLLKPATAAQKLGVFLPATPAEFQSTPIFPHRAARASGLAPEWLVTLRREGPHPRSETARRLGVSNSALARAGVSDA